MAQRAPKPCAHPGCPNLVRGRPRCPQHRKATNRIKDIDRRKQRDRRAYDRRAWRDHIRPMQLGREPLCRFCAEQGRTELATEVDHIDGNPWNNGEDNLRSLCQPCHSGRTMREQVHGRPEETS